LSLGDECNYREDSGKYVNKNKMVYKPHDKINIRTYGSIK